MDLTKAELIAKAKRQYRDNGRQYGYILEDGTFLSVEGETEHKDVCKLWKPIECDDIDIIAFQQMTNAVRVNGRSISILNTTPLTESQKKRLLDQCEERMRWGSSHTKVYLDIVNTNFETIRDYNTEIFNCKRDLPRIFYHITTKAKEELAKKS